MVKKVKSKKKVMGKKGHGSIGSESKRSKVNKVKKTNKVTMTAVIKVTARLTVPVTTPQAIPCATKTVIATRAMYTPPALPQVAGGVCGIIPEATPVKTTPPVKGQ